MLKLLKHHIFTLHEKIGLLVVYGIAMFCMGMGANYIFAPKQDVSAPEAIIDLPEGRPEAIPDAEREEDALRTVLEQVDEPEAEPEGEPVIEPEKTDYSEYTTDLVVRKGDTVADLLIGAGVDRKEAFDASEALGKFYNLRQLRIGQKMQAVFREGDAVSGGQPGEAEFVLLKLEEPERFVTLQKAADGSFAVQEQVKQLTRELMRAEGVITSSLYVLANSLGIPMNVLQDAVNAFSYDVDFQRDIQPGTKFGVLYEVYNDERGTPVRDGNMLYATLTLEGRALEIYRFSPTGKDDDAEYYTADGAELRKQLMKTPIDGARISSPFGMRKHPISGYTKMHKGVDFAAPRGTPVFAAGDGDIRQIGWKGGYGNYIRIRHSGEYDTAYGHLNRFALGIKRGRKVKQGQVIAYVGSTGKSTGPHLHFEVLKRGVQINPVKMNLAPARKLGGKELALLKVRVKEIRAALAATGKQLIVPSGDKLPRAVSRSQPVL